MSDGVATVGSKIGVADSPTVDGGTTAPRLHLVGYCAGCGTWDEHGPTCFSCGYDFSVSETSFPTD